MWLETCTSVNSRNNGLLPVILQELCDFTINYQEVASEQYKDIPIVKLWTLSQDGVAFISPHDLKNGKIV